MVMSIEESIENLVLIKKFEDSLGNISGYTNSVASQSLGCAINTMRKYQKIEQITQNTSITDGSNAYAIAFIDIKRVIEDENNN